jgi:sigma-B regulation protein RsbU (phosphoserine phosphatase)
VGIRLVRKGPGGETQRLEFDRPKITLGSDPLCDVTIADEGVAGEQAVLVQRDDHHEIFDIGERGGVLVNGRPVSHAVLRPGDEIWLGRTVLYLDAAPQGVAFVSRGSATVRASVPSAGLQSPAPLPGFKGRSETERRMALFNEVGRLVNSIGLSEDIFESILDAVFATVPVRRGFLALTRPSGDLDVKAHRNRERDGAGTIEVSQTLVRRVLDTGQAVLTSDAEGDPDFSAARSIHRLRIKAAVCVPLVVEGKVIGLLYGDNREQPGSLAHEDLAYLSALASVAAAAVEKFRLLGEYDAKRKIEQALAIARSIHRSFLPSSPPAVPGLELWGRSQTCDETGGDYFDYFPLGGSKLGVVVGDVTGHGIGSALLMATVRASLRALLDTDPPLHELFPKLNELVRRDVRDGRFVTLFYALLDPVEGCMHHVGAGHTPPILYRARDGSTATIASGGPPLGVVSGLRFPPGRPLPIERGDVLLLTTDGIVEAMDASGEPFGLARLGAVVAEHARSGAPEIGQAVTAAVEAFSGRTELHDDATLVVAKVTSA